VPASRPIPPHNFSHTAILAKHLKSKIIMQVHDELVFDVPKDEEEIMKKNIKEIMENIISDEIKLIVDIETGKNWKECK
jgi:DNA polymerase-1